jgi:hypothetical protein
MYCNRCDYPLDPASRGRCPECGLTFDPRNPLTTSRHPRAFLRARAIGRAFRALLVVVAVATGVAFMLSMIGTDLLLLMLGGFAMLPLLLLLWILAALPRTPVRARTRVVAVLLPLLLASIAVKSWPFHLSFRLHRSGLEALALRIRNGEDVPDRPRVGILSFKRVRVADGGNLGLQLTGGSGGGVHLVKKAPDSAWLWDNTNWEMDLGDGWFLVFED